MTDFMIETRQLTKSFKGQPALRGLDLRVPRGSIFGFLGRNVAGKTTTIKMLMGLLRAVLIICASGLYFISVLLATFLDDQWRMYGSMIAFGAFWWLPNHARLPASTNIFRAMMESSPLVAHTMPWTAMAFSLGLAVSLFFAALHVVRTRES
jgi:ABC transporter family protein